MGEMGQSINLKVVKVERVFRAVRDRATSSEQLAKVREMRFLKGLEESQIMVELWRGEQGFLPVGMLRDWRALTCFGFSEEAEVGVGVGVEGVGFAGVGEDAGDGEVEGRGAVGALVGEMVVGGWSEVEGLGAAGALVGEMVAGGWREAERAMGENWRRRRRGPRMKNGGACDDAIFFVFSWKNVLEKTVCNGSEE